MGSEGGKPALAQSQDVSHSGSSRAGAAHASWLSGASLPWCRQRQGRLVRGSRVAGKLEQGRGRRLEA